MKAKIFLHVNLLNTPVTYSTYNDIIIALIWNDCKNYQNQISNFLASGLYEKNCSSRLLLGHLSWIQLKFNPYLREIFEQLWLFYESPFS